MAMWLVSRSKQREIEGRLDRVAVAMFCYVMAMVLRSVDDNLRRKILVDLRECVRMTGTSSTGLTSSMMIASVVPRRRDQARGTLNANGPGSTLLEHSKRAVARGLRMRPNPRSGF